jgi:hypothetical protein
MRNILSSVIVLAFLAVPASAQTNQRPPRQSSRYTPSKPTVSPYMNLFRNDTDNVPNYQTLVRPQIQQQAVNQQVARNLDRQQVAVQSLQQEVLHQRQPSIRSTGTGATTNNYSHYFPTPQTKGRRR